MHRLHHLAVWAESHRELWLDCVRIYVGLGLFVRGLLLVSNARTGFFFDLLSRAGEPWLISGTPLHYVAIAHFVGGAFLAAGLVTRLAALVQVPALAGAVFIVHWHEGLIAPCQSLELSALVLFLLCIVIVGGAGRFSLDRVVFGGHGRHDEDLAGLIPPR